jgi:hypothetical protein
VKNPADYLLSFRIQKAGRNADELAKIKVKTPAGVLDGNDILRLSDDNRVMGSGWVGSDIMKAAKEEAMSLTPGSIAGLAVEKPMAINKLIGQALEDNGRMAHFITKIKKGMSPMDAADSVKKFLFDYEDLSETERFFFKRIIPFWTWTRKNIPLQVEMMIRNPAKYSKVEKTIRGIQGEESTKDMPFYLKESSTVPLPIKGRAGKKYGFSLEQWLPAFDINRFTTSPERGFREFMNMMNPLIKLPVTLGTGIDLYTGKPLEKFPGERTQTLWGSTNKRWSYPFMQSGLAPHGVRPIRELGRFKEKGLGDIPTWVRYLTGLRTEDWEPERSRYMNFRKRQSDANALLGSINRMMRMIQDPDTPEARKQFLMEEISRVKKQLRGIYGR